MSDEVEPTHLDKAKAALADAGALQVDLGSDKLPVTYLRLLDLASTQAQLAQAESIDRLTAAIEKYGKQFTTALQQSGNAFKGW